jgi:hypothetical protein
VRWLATLLFGIVLGAVGTSALLLFHVVQTPQGTLFISRSGPVRDPFFADVRNYTPQDWKKHPQLTRALIEAGHAELVENSLARGLIEQVRGRLSAPSAKRDSDSSWD